MAANRSGTAFHESTWSAVIEIRKQQLFHFNDEASMLKGNSLDPKVFTILALIAGLGATTLGAARFLAAEMSGFAIARYSIAAGGGTSGTATISPASAAVEIVTFTSSNPAVATVAATIPIAPGGSMATSPIIGTGAGCVTITAKHRTKTRSRDLIVHPASSGSTITMTVPDQLLVLGGTYGGRVNAGLMTGIPVALKSSDPAVVSVPPSVETVRGIASFNMVTHREGCVTISASIRAQTVSKIVRVYDIGG
jgi:hypothetical protein